MEEDLQFIFEIKPAKRNDIKAIFKMIMELAEYEKLAHTVIGSEEDLERYSFGEEKVAHIYCGWLVPKLYHRDINQNESYMQGNAILIGYTLHYLNYSTFFLRPGVYLEDIYVSPEFRGKGYGKKLLLHLCKFAKDKNYALVEWQVLNTLTSSIKFYESLGAKPLSNWIQFRVSGDGMTKCSIDFEKLNLE